MRQRRRRMAAGLAFDADADVPQRGLVRCFVAELECDRATVAHAERRLSRADAVDLTRPHGLARQRLGLSVEQGELDARRAAVEHDDGFTHGKLLGGRRAALAPAPSR